MRESSLAFYINRTSNRVSSIGRFAISRAVVEKEKGKSCRKRRLGFVVATSFLRRGLVEAG